MNVLVTAKLSDKKLASKLVGLQGMDEVDKIFLIRETPLLGKKIYNINPSLIVRGNRSIYEIWRFCAVLLWASKKEVTALLGIQAVLHGLAAVVAAKIFRKPNILWLIGSDIYIQAPRRFSGLPVRWAIEHATVVLSMGSAMHRRIASFTKRRDIVTTLPCIDIADIEIEVDTIKKFDLIYVGNLIAVKNLFGLLDIVKELNDDDIHTSLLITGDGPLFGDLIAYTSKLMLLNQITFTGYIEQPYSLMKQSRLMTLLSHSEGLPSAITEAGLAGLPVVASDVGDIRSFYGLDSHVVLVPPDDHRVQYTQIKSLLTNSRRLQFLSNKARQFAKIYRQDWGPEMQASHWVRIMQLAMSD